jgi:large subunit ribosomal protein L27
MAHVKAGGKARQHSQRPGKRLGVKLFGGQIVKAGNIIVRQRGAEFHPGSGTKIGKDFTIYALINGAIHFKSLRGRQYVEVLAKTK